MPLLKKVVIPPGPILTLVIVEGKCGPSLFLLRCRHTPPSTTRCSSPPPSFWKFHISSTPPSRTRTVETAFMLLLTARTRRYEPDPVTTTSFVVSALAEFAEKVRPAPYELKSPPSLTMIVVFAP